jgi:hypothetical protein
MSRSHLAASATLLLALSAAACRSSDAPSPGAGAAAGTARSAAAASTGAASTGRTGAETRSFGAPLVPGETVPFTALLSTPDTFASKTVTVEAQVRRNCTKKGCWMEIAEGPDPSAPGCRVTFKDYGFFVPLSSAGARARVQGEVEVKTVAPAEVQHLEAEGAKFAGKQPDGSAREIRIVASGVELTRTPG